MSKAIAVLTFDYSQVAPDEKGKLIRLAGQLKKHGDAMLLAGNEVRKVLVEAHSMLAHHRAGLFDEWVQTESDVSLSTAYNCLNVEKRALDFPILENLPPTVAYLLSAPQVPDKAIEDFAKQVDRGAKPTIEACKATLKRFRTVKPKRNKPAATVSSDLSTAPPDLPPEGTVNRTDQGSQGKGAGGKNSEAWTPPEGVTRYNDKFEPTDEPASELFKDILEHLRKAVLVLDKLQHAVPHALHDDVFTSLDCANRDLLKWRKAAK